MEHTALRDHSPAFNAATGLDPWAVPALIGHELATAVQALDASLRDLRAAGALTGGEWTQLRSAVRSVHATAVASQQLSRLAEGRVRQAHEPVSLRDTVQAVASDNAKDYTARGLELDLQLRALDVIADASLLHALVQAAIEYCSAHGSALLLATRQRNWPDHAQLVVRARRPVMTRDSRADADTETLDWVLVAQLARAMGAVARREHLPDHTQVTLEFPKTVRRDPGLTAIEIESGDFQQTLAARPLAGLRVLLVTEDAAMRSDVEIVCRQMGLVLDTSPSVERAVRSCELDKPHGILIDGRLNDRTFNDLREDLMRYDANYPVIEIAAEDNVLAISSWHAQSMSRVGRTALRTQLGPMLSMELAKVA